MSIFHLIVPGLLLAVNRKQRIIGLMLVIAAIGNWAHLQVLFHWVPVKLESETNNGATLYWSESVLTFLPSMVYAIFNHVLLSLISLFVYRGLNSI